MSLGTKLRGKSLVLIAGIVTALFCSAGIATIMDWGMSPARKAAERTGLIAFLKGGDVNRPAMARQETHDAVAIVRTTARCAGCGVIESIVVADMRDETGGACAAADWVDYGFGHNKFVEAGGRVLAPLGDIVAEAVATNSSAPKMKSAPGYELTIRFRDGARSSIRLASQPRWKLGERVRIINNQT
jgi:outer membrane lipoprotein SlyB